MICGGGDVGEEDMYREELVLALLFDSYSEPEAILVSASGPSFCPTLQSTDYLYYQLLS